MANYNATARTNYFRVRDLDAFKRDLLAHGIEVGGWGFSEFVLNDSETNTPDGAIALFSYGPWPLLNYDGYDDEDTGEEETVHESLHDLVAAHLIDGDVATFIEVGFEKMRYLGGVALAINSAGETKCINLNDITELAASLGTTVTQPSY